jgi:hypothetical protein
LDDAILKPGSAGGGNMKSIIVRLLGMFILSQQLSLNVFAQHEVYVMPAARAGEAYQAIIPQVLREQYMLRVESGSGLARIQWLFIDGDIPAGLEISGEGAITGRPTYSREQPFSFRVKIVDLAETGAEPLVINLNLSVKAPRVRLVKVNGPELVRESESIASHATLGGANGKGTDPVKNGGVYSIQPLQTSPVPSPVASQRGVASQSSSAVSCVLPPEFIPPTGPGVITIDARTGIITRNGEPIAGEQRFNKGAMIRVVVDNKNPYLYTYSYKSERKTVSETAIGTFLPALGGIISDFIPKAEQPAKTAAIPERAPGGPAVDPCQRLIDELELLNKELRRAAQLAAGIEELLSEQKAVLRGVLRLYEQDKKGLYDRSKKREALYCASKKLLADTETGVDPAKLAEIQQGIGRLKSFANSIPARIDLIKRAYEPRCVAQVISSLLDVQIYAVGLSASADAYQKSSDEIKEAQDKINETRTKVQAIVNDPLSFFEVHAEGGGSTTIITTATLDLKPLPDIKEATPAGPFSVSIKTGEAPFFSLTGGLVFSALERFEFQRVQGFERDRQGNEVLVDGKPNFTSVVDLKEGSRTRILPMVMLNGRLPGTQRGILDGVHISLGITAKNDNKGADLEFLLGPSFSLLEDNIFFTVGGYAGRQQKLEGNLFPGVAVPSDLAELPVRKDYRWHIGFGLTYRIPVNSGDGKK